MPAEASKPSGITPSDALTRFLNILDKVDDSDDPGDHYTGELSPRHRVVRALAAFYDVPAPVITRPDDGDQR